jgi:D-alanyl-D-alanine carboxypeptidase
MPRSHRGRGLLAVIGVAVLALTACAPPTSAVLEPVAQVDASLPADMQEQLQTAVETAMAATGSTGAIVEVRAPWAGVWKKALGTTTVGGAAVSADMTFKAGLITRTMTCDVLYGMAHQGIVSLDDPLTDWLSGYPSAANVTLGQLCDSSSGLSSRGARRSSSRTASRRASPRSPAPPTATPTRDTSCWVSRWSVRATRAPRSCSPSTSSSPSAWMTAPSRPRRTRRRAGCTV